MGRRDTGYGLEEGRFKGCTYAASHRFALKSRWMTWSSMSTWLLRYESIIWPIGVVRSWERKGGMLASQSGFLALSLTQRRPCSVCRS